MLFKGLWKYLLRVTKENNEKLHLDYSILDSNSVLLVPGAGLANTGYA
jgi:hypothetical protein